MKMEYLFSLIRFWHGNLKKYVLVITLILSASLAVHIHPIGGATLPQSLTLLYSNNINAEIDPCPV